MSFSTTLTPIQTHCGACGNAGMTAWTAAPGFELDEYLAGLRQRCPDCGASGREATALSEPPDPSSDPEAASMWREVEAMMLAGEQQRRAPDRVGRNDPCPCGSGKKYKRCCG